MKTKRILKCRRCGWVMGKVSVKPAFQKKLLIYSMAIVFSFELVANFLSNVAMKLLGM